MRARVVFSVVASLLAMSTVVLGDEPPIAISYRSASNVYLDGGRDRGLALGDRLLVGSGAETVAELEVVFLSERSAACRVVTEARAVRVGDVVVPLPRRAPVEAAAVTEEEFPATTLARAKRSPSRPWARVRGVVAVGYYRIWDESPAGLDFRQSTARLGLTLTDIGGRPYAVRLRARTRQNHRARALSSRTPRDQRIDRLYELSLRYESDDHGLAYEIGRLGASRYVGIGYLDGMLLRMRVADPIQVGGFFGEESVVDGFRLVGSGRKYGAFVDLAPGGSYSTSPYGAVLAVVREFAGQEISRDYVSFDGRAGSGRLWSLYARGELDVNTGWRLALADSRYQLSNVSASLNLRPSPTSSLSLSYDSRRRYRSHLNRSVPEDIFDDLLHQGLRASVHLGQSYGFNVTGGGGVRFKEDDEQRTYSYYGGIRHGDLWESGVSTGLDVSGFSNPFTEGTLLTARLGMRFGRASQLDLAYGRSLYRFKAGGERRNTEWVRLQTRADVIGGLYLLIDFEYDMGDDLQGPRGFLELGYLF